MGFFLKEEEETRNEDLAGKEKKLGHLSRVFCRKGFRGHVVCNVMFAYLPLRVREILAEEGPPRPKPPTPHSLLFTPQLTLHVTHLNNQHRDQAAANQRASTQPSHSPLSLFQRMALFFPSRPLNEGAGLSPLPHWPLSHHFSKQALTRIKEYHHQSSAVIPCLDKVLTGPVSRLDGK